MSGTAARAWIEADWPAPVNVRALTTTRHGLGVSQPPFDHFNLGARCGDAPDAVAENRRQLAEALGLPKGTVDSALFNLKRRLAGSRNADAA